MVRFDELSYVIRQITAFIKVINLSLLTLIKIRKCGKANQYLKGATNLGTISII